MFLLCLPLAQISQDVKSSKMLRKVFIIVSCMSIFISFVGAHNAFVAVDEQRPSSFLNALFYSFKPIAPQIYGDSQAMPLPFSYSLLFVLKPLRVILIAGLAGLSCYLLVNRVKQFVANRPLLEDGTD
jgi:hypothetical protein